MELGLGTGYLSCVLTPIVAVLVWYTFLSPTDNYTSIFVSASVKATPLSSEVELFFEGSVLGLRNCLLGDLLVAPEE